MRGRIRNTGRNCWQIIVELAPIDGQRHRHFEKVHGLKADAQARLNELLNDLEKGIQPSRGRITVAEHLHNWLEGYVKTNCSHRTLDGYTSIVERPPDTRPGAYPVKVTSSQQPFRSYYGKACEKLSRRTVHHQHRVLSQSLEISPSDKAIWDVIRVTWWTRLHPKRKKHAHVDAR